MSIVSCRRNKRALRLADALEAAESTEDAVLRMERSGTKQKCLGFRNEEKDEEEHKEINL